QFTPPWQASFDLQVTRQPLECLDKLYHSQEHRVLQSWSNNDRPNNVSSNEELETEQNRAAHILPVKRIIIACLVGAMRSKSHRGNDHPTCNDEYTHAIHAGTDHFHDVPKIFHACVHSRKAC